MKNCLIAQSGGPTTVINSSVVGILEKNNALKTFDKVLVGFNGIEGILQDKVYDANEVIKDPQVFRYTPSSGLGSCRYKLPDYKKDSSDYENFIKILEKHEVKTFFYIGGNDSMDTIKQMHLYSREHNISIDFIGVPKTIDNDLPITDHCPGFGSAAKFIAASVLETYLDSSVYLNNGAFVIETMGRDTGWLAASARLAEIDGIPCADLIYLPEIAFCRESFLKDVEKIFREKGKVYIVVSEGIRDAEGNFLSALNASSSHDKFGHQQLGGAGKFVSELIKDSGITNRVKSLELGVLQRCAMHFASAIDIQEAYEAGAAACEAAAKGISGYMITIERVSNAPYKTNFGIAAASEVANNVKYFPAEWITKENNNINQEALNYLSPLVSGCPELMWKDHLPKYTFIR